jgi:hypothetical protein
MHFEALAMKLVEADGGFPCGYRVNMPEALTMIQNILDRTCHGGSMRKNDEDFQKFFVGDLLRNPDAAKVEK